MEPMPISSISYNSLSSKGRNYFIIACLLLVFAGPLIAAWSLYSTQWYAPPKLNRGILLEPVISANHLNLKFYNGLLITKNFWINKWWLIYLIPKNCTEDCMNRLYDLQQIQTATGKYMDQVGKIMVTIKKEPSLAEMVQKKYPMMQQLWMAPKDYNQLKTQIHQQTNFVLNSKQFGNVLLADPKGNLMMVYQDQQKSQDIFKDLKRLLAANATA